jgi:3'-phosphoadenosine 5'-phosphosulfate sulfotransferase (PAPS reductase)/FAD synthetase
LQPVYKEYIQFLKSNNVDVSKLKEGYYWIDRQIIRGYDFQGKEYKIMRIKIHDDLSVSYSFYKNKLPTNFETWYDTAKRKEIELKQLEKNSINLIKNKLKKYNNYIPIILTSTGKDSNVTSYLVNKVIKNPKSIFNNTSIDYADTYLMAKKIPNCEICSPKEGFYQRMDRILDVPSRQTRWCCGIYKEHALLKALNKNEKYIIFMGMRNQESIARSGYQDEEYMTQWGTRNWIGILPIREWSEQNIWLYTILNNIPINNIYKKGYKRVGCMIVCPFTTKHSRVLDKYFYPRMYERWKKYLKRDFIERKMWTRLYCTLNEYYQCWNDQRIFRKEPTEEVIKEFAAYKGINYDVAKKYFNHTCDKCGKKVYKADDIAMNLKFIGRDTEVFYCQKCFCELLNIDKKGYKELIDRCKCSGCQLF